MIPYLLPAQQQGFLQENSHSAIPLICELQVDILSITLYNSFNFPTALTIFVYLSLKYPEKVEQKGKCLKWGISILCWILSIIGGLVIFLFSVKGTEDDLVCWVGRDF